MLDQIVTVGAVAVALSAVIGLFYLIHIRIARPIWRGVKMAIEFFEDMRGEPPRPGFPGRPGMMERIERVEHQTRRTELHLGNGGPVMMHTRVEAIDQRTFDLVRRINAIEGTNVIPEHRPGEGVDPSSPTP